MPRGFDQQPISRVEWVDRDTLHANEYNPNHVAPPELELLRRSLLADGWTQPIVARRDGEIVDGFHRWKLSGEKAIRAMTEGQVPVVYLRDGASLVEQMASTIRHNRARGEHGVDPMAAIVRRYVEAGVSLDDIAAELGMEDEEVARLSDLAGMPVWQGTGEFGKGWVPTASPE